MEWLLIALFAPKVFVILFWLFAAYFVLCIAWAVLSSLTIEFVVNFFVFIGIVIGVIWWTHRDYDPVAEAAKHQAQLQAQRQVEAERWEKYSRESREALQREFAKLKAQPKWQPVTDPAILAKLNAPTDPWAQFPDASPRK
ncbi:MAG: hypothetical protein WBX25_13990 [Rhodomicrobium sp.]